MRPLNLDTVLIVRTDRELHAALHGVARREGTTASALVRRAVASIIAPEDPPPTPPAAPAVILRTAA